jgi:cytochrome b561
VTIAQSILLIGSLASLVFATTAGFTLYWVRLRNVALPPPRYALITHMSAVTGALVLIALFVAMPYSGFTEGINVTLAVAEVVVVAASSVRNVWSWRLQLVDGMAEVDERSRRLRGLGNVVHFVVASSLLYGVTRTALGI